MARSSLAKSSPKLNLSRRQIALFRNIILAGSRMADAILSLDKQSAVPKRTKKAADRWRKLMVALVDMRH